MIIKKKIIVRVAEGLGNQLFMYANGLALAKKNNAFLYIDNESGFFKKKNKLRSREYSLNLFKADIQICDSIDKFNTYPKDFIRKLLKILDSFKSKKVFLFENLKNKNFLFKEKSKLSFDNKLYVEGHFESEKYFSFLEKELSCPKSDHSLLSIGNKSTFDLFFNNFSINLSISIF